MRFYGLGCGGWIGAIIVLVILLRIAGCIIGEIWDGTQEVLAERHARQEVADARARERLAQETAQREAAERKEAEEKREAERVAASRKAEEDKVKAAADREDRLRTFAIKEAATLWQTYLALGAQIGEQGKRIEELRMTLVEFDKIPDLDPDFEAICAQREEMIGTRASLHKKLEDAYLAFRKFEATPSRKEYDALRRKVLEDGIREADEAAKRFTIMRKEK